MKIKVDVNNVTIMEKSDIHKGEYNVNKCIFEFSSEYTKDLIYRAVFSCINGSFYQLILNNECNIPEEILREKDVNIELGVYAYILNDDNELELRYSPKPTYFRVENGSYKDADKTEVPSPTDYEKFLNEFNRNANEKTENFNKNYENKKAEIDKVAEVVSKDKSYIEDMKKSVETSEANAQKSEENAKKSEETAGEYLDEVKNISNAMTFANFEVDVETGELQINTPERFENAGFSVNENGDLEVEISGQN